MKGEAIPSLCRRWLLSRWARLHACPGAGENGTGQDGGIRFDDCAGAGSDWPLAGLDGAAEVRPAGRNKKAALLDIEMGAEGEKNGVDDAKDGAEGERDIVKDKKDGANEKDDGADDEKDEIKWML